MLFKTPPKTYRRRFGLCNAHDNHLCQFCFNRAKSKPIQKREGSAYPSRFLLHIYSGLTSPIFIVLIVVLAVAVLILAGVLLSNLFGGQQNSSSASSSATEESQPTNSNQTTTNTPSSEVTDADRELYSTLSSYYSRLGDYDQRIASAAKTFNADYVSKNMSVRSADASSAYALAEEIADDYNALKSLSVPSTSRYASCYSAMLTCYYDCTQRIGAISESWDISLQYSDPTGHEDEICAPLSRDRSGDNNKYYTEFKQTYPSAKPQSPTA